MIKCFFENEHPAALRHAVVDVLVVKDTKILLVKRVNKLLEGGKWGLVGGYMERDENLKEAAAREIFEETGYRVTDITLLTINDRPDRPHEDRQNMAFVFYCTALEQEGTPDNESSEIHWFSFSELPPPEQIAFDHYDDIQLYLQHTNGATIPLLR